MNTDLMFSSSKQDWETPKELFDIINKNFICSLDVCCDENNKKCPYYFTIEDNGLEKDWNIIPEHVYAFCNPPYKDVEKWLEKGYSQYKNNKVSSVFLIPARTDTIYFHDYVFNKADYLIFIKGRVKFLDNKKEIYPAPFPSCLVVYKVNKDYKEGRKLIVGTLNQKTKTINYIW